MTDTPDIRKALADLLAHAERANQIMLDEAGIGVCDLSAIEAARAALAAPGQAPQPVALDYRGALEDLCAEFKRVYPIYYYAEPWAHDRNAVLQHALILLAEGKRLAARPQAQPTGGQE